MKRTYYLASILALLLFSNLVSSTLSAQVIVEPKRLVFDNNNRAGSFNLTYGGNDTATFKLALVDMKMDEDGVMTELPDSVTDSMSAKKITRYFPHEITLMPKESQAIRVQIMRPPNLAAGEYRSHLSIIPVAKVTPMEADTGHEMHFHIKVMLGATMPVIFRNGTSSSNASISDIQLHKDSTGKDRWVTLKIHRNGKQSLYGKILVEHIAPDGSKTRSGFMSGIGVYCPLEYRNVNIPVNLSDTEYSSGKLVISFETFTGDENEKLLAQGELHM